MNFEDPKYRLGFGDGSNLSSVTIEKPPMTTRELQSRWKLLPPQNPEKPRHVVWFPNAEAAAIMAEMRCSFCNYVVPAPLEWTCKVGHLICRECGVYLPGCPWEPPGQPGSLCREPFVRSSLKFYDYLFYKSTFECPNRVHGCPVSPAGSEFKDHVQICRFAPPQPWFCLSRV